jgi:hypothetical protein
VNLQILYGRKMPENTSKNSGFAQNLVWKCRFTAAEF